VYVRVWRWVFFFFVSSSPHPCFHLFPFAHNNIVVNMGKGPVFYFEIGKKAKDLLLKDYTYDHKFLIATTTQSRLMS
jgi:hypothetical protein